MREARKKRRVTMKERNLAFIKPLPCVGTKCHQTLRIVLRRGPADACGGCRKGGGIADLTYSGSHS